MEDSRNYYGQPVLKEPVWIWAVPTYFYVGGIAGGSLVIAAAARLADGRALDEFIRRCCWVGGLAGLAGSGLLILDLGRPERFLHMLRVFRPTSPMSVGSWILTAFTPLAFAGALLGGRSRMGRAAIYPGGVLGASLAGYTGVLLGNTAVPVWRESRKTLPVLFLASAGSSAADFLDLLCHNKRERQILRLVAIPAGLAELAAKYAWKSQGADGGGRSHASQGLPGRLLKASGWLKAAGFAAGLLARRSQKARVASAVLGAAGALALRFAVHEAGKSSSRDPEDTFQRQRAVRAPLSRETERSLSPPGAEQET